MPKGSFFSLLPVFSSRSRIARANNAACRMLGFTEGSPEGEPVDRYIPLLARLQESPQAARLMRTMVEASGHRRNGGAGLQDLDLQLRARRHRLHLLAERVSEVVPEPAVPRVEVAEEIAAGIGLAARPDYAELRKQVARLRRKTREISEQLIV